MRLSRTSQDYVAFIYLLPHISTLRQRALNNEGSTGLFFCILINCVYGHYQHIYTDSVNHQRLYIEVKFPNFSRAKNHSIMCKWHNFMCSPFHVMYFTTVKWLCCRCCQERKSCQALLRKGKLKKVIFLRIFDVRKT